MGVSREYYEYFSYFGDVIIIPNTDTIIPVDLLVLPGGADVATTRYSPKRLYSYGSQPNRFMEHFDVYNLPLYIEAVKQRKVGAIFGICRGLQTLNVHFGGTLYQHLLDEPTNKEFEREKLTQKGLVHDAPFYKGPKKIEFNSMHHQAIRDLGEGLSPMIFSENKTRAVENFTPFSVVEGIRHETLPIMGVQYHPEEIYDEFAFQAINYLLNVQ